MTAAVDELARVVVDTAAAAGATAEQWASLEWRLDHLYWIVDKQAQAVRFTLNDQQRRLVRSLWYRNLVVKARQLGISTLVQLIALDQTWTRQHHQTAVIADTLPNAGKLLGKIEFAYAHLPELLREAYPVARREVGSLLTIAHTDSDGRPANSTISVSVSSRGGTVNLLHVSELGKISLKFPDRAEEIKTGAIPSVPPDGVIVIESTAEGQFGLLWDLAEPAIKRWHAKAPETRLDWRLHFFPWYEAPEYTLPPEEVTIVEVPAKLTAYFRKLEVELGVKLSPGQRAWYAKTSEDLAGKMKQEYPSTPEEAFEGAVEGSIYGEQMTWLREQGRLAIVPLDPTHPVNTFWDFGTGKTNSIWFHQQIGVQHRWFYYVSGASLDEDGKAIKSLSFWWLEVLEKHRHRHGYSWGKHVLPHDADAEILGQVSTTKHRILRELGMGVGEGGTIVVVPRVATIFDGIEITRKAMVGNHWFDRRKPDAAKGEDMGAGHGIACLDGYQFAWNDKYGTWDRGLPVHNWASHGADAWRQFAQMPDGSTFLHTSTSLTAFKARKRRGI